MAMTKDSLSNELDTFFSSLLKEAQATPTTAGEDQSEDAPPPIGFLDRLRLFSEGVRWAGVKARVETEDTDDEFSRLRRGTVGRARIRGRSTAPPANGHA
jgi:hypothetical protein